MSAGGAHQPPVFQDGRWGWSLCVFRRCGSRFRFFRGGAQQHINLLAFFQLVEMLAVAAGLDVQIQVRAYRGAGLHGIGGVLTGKLLESIKNFRAGEIALLHPSFFTASRADAEEAPVATALPPLPRT